MKNQENDNLNEAQEVKIALQELADITLDKYIIEKKKKSYEQKNKKNSGRKSV